MTDNKIKSFYIKGLSREEQAQVIDRCVLAGAEKDEGLQGYHNGQGFPSLLEYNYPLVGIRLGHTYLNDRPTSWKDDAIEITLDQLEGHLGVAAVKSPKPVKTIKDAVEYYKGVFPNTWGRCLGNIKVILEVTALVEDLPCQLIGDLVEGSTAFNPTTRRQVCTEQEFNDYIEANETKTSESPTPSNTIPLRNIKVDLRKEDGTIDEKKSKAFQEAVFTSEGIWISGSATFKLDMPFIFVCEEGYMTKTYSANEDYFLSQHNKQISFDFNGTYWEVTEYGVPEITDPVEKTIENVQNEYPRGKHKHHDVIIGFAKGAIIQFKSVTNQWVDTYSPHWGESVEFRIKPSDEEVEAELKAIQKEFLQQQIVELQAEADKL